MANLISVPNDNDQVMNADRARLSIWAPLNSWIYTAYNDESDHVAQLQAVAAGQSMTVLDFDCHGSPTQFDHTDITSVAAFGPALSQSTGFSAQSVIYLDGCNTGLTSDLGGPIAQALANATGATVFGSQGYLTGTHAEGTEQCYATTAGLPPYPGAIDAVGDNVWKTFVPTQVRVRTVRKGSSVTIRLSDREKLSESATALAEMINEELGRNPIELPALRIAPDITINYIRHDNNVNIIDVYANGHVLRDRISGRAYRVSDQVKFTELIRLQYR